MGDGQRRACRDPGRRRASVARTHRRDRAQPRKVGARRGRRSAGLDRDLGVAATNDIAAVLDANPPGASSTPRPATSVPTTRSPTSPARIRAGAVVVTPSVYPLYDPRNAPAAIIDPVNDAIKEGGGSLFVSGVDPGWGNDVLPLLISGLGSTIDVIRCQEIFDYSAYDQPDSVRYLVGMGQPMDYEPPMIAPTVPTMVWGGQIRLMARALEVELDEIREVVERRPLDATVTTEDDGRRSTPARRARCASRCRASSAVKLAS